MAVQPAPLLVALGERLHDLGGDGTGFLTRVHQEHADDFWAALTLARALQEGPNPEAAVPLYRRALKLRGDSAAVYSNLGLVSFARRDWHDAFVHYQKALELDPKFAPAHNNLGLALKGEGNWPDAVHHFREAVRLDPEQAPAHYNLGEIRAYEGGLDEAIDHYRLALRYDPGYARAEYLLGVALAGRGRLDEANDRNQRALRHDPEGAAALKKFRGWAVAEGIIHYHQTLTIDPELTLCRNNLGITPRDADRLDEAIDQYQKAIRMEPGLSMARAALGRALVALGRFREAEAATRRCLDQLPQRHELRANVLAQLRRCERLIALQDRLSAVLQGKDKPADASELLEFAELCGLQGQDVAAARLHAEALGASSRLADDLHAEHRYRAACAATLVGCGRGANAAGLSEADRAQWRQRAREWLGAEVTNWTSVLDRGPHADRFLVAKKLARLWADPQLDGLLDHEAMDRLPQAERQECRELRDAIDILIRRLKPLIESRTSRQATAPSESQDGCDAGGL